MRRPEIALLLCAVAAALGGCMKPAPPATAAELAQRLTQEGVSYNSTKELPLPSGSHFRFDEGIALESDTLWVELIRIEDTKVFNIARDGSGLLILAEASAGRELPGKPKIYTRRPYLVVVRQEPSDGYILAALNEILPPEE